MSNHNVLTQEVLNEAREARKIIAEVCKTAYDNDGAAGLSSLLIALAIEENQPMAGFMNYELLTNYIDKLPQELRPMYEAQIALEREWLAELLDALDTGIIPNAPSTDTLP